MLTRVARQSRLAEEPARDVHLVDALVADVAVAVQVDPVPVVVDGPFFGLSMRRHERRGAAPEVVVHRRGDRLRAGRLADAVAALVAEAARRGDLAEVARLDPLHGLAQPLAASGSACRPARPCCTSCAAFDELAAFPHVVATPASRRRRPCRPASPRSPASECQWFGVAIVTASMSLLSSSLRMSV